MEEKGIPGLASSEAARAPQLDVHAFKFLISLQISTGLPALTLYSDFITDHCPIPVKLEFEPCTMPVIVNCGRMCRAAKWSIANNLI